MNPARTAPGRPGAAKGPRDGRKDVRWRCGPQEGIQSEHARATCPAENGPALGQTYGPAESGRKARIVGRKPMTGEQWLEQFRRLPLDSQERVKAAAIAVGVASGICRVDRAGKLTLRPDLAAALAMA